MAAGTKITVLFSKKDIGECVKNSDTWLDSMIPELYLTASIYFFLPSVDFQGFIAQDLRGAVS